MSKPRILVQLDTDPRPSVFDAVVAIDAGAERLLSYGGVTPENVRDLVYGAIFTRGPKDLANTAIFVGGSDVQAGEALVRKIEKTFLGPLRVSVLMDSNGANTTAAAAVLAAKAELDLKGAQATVLAATGPVGQRVVRLLAGQGAKVRVVSRQLEKARAAVEAIRQRLPEAQLAPLAAGSADEAEQAVRGAQVVIAAGAPGVELLSAEARKRCESLVVAIDLNAVPPVGLAGVDVHDRAAEKNGVKAYGALGVGAAKMKIHKASVVRLFESNASTLDAEDVFAIGLGLS